MDKEQSSARVPFDMRLHVTPMAQTSYTADHYHAMKRLVSEGYVMIKPNAKLRLGPNGLWEADGQPPLVETISREESPVELYISTKTVNAKPVLGSNPSHGNQGYNWGLEDDNAQIIRLMDRMNEVLTTRHDNAHPAWDTLQKSLENSCCLYWTMEALEAAIIKANNEEIEDWNVFNMSMAYCAGNNLEFRHRVSVNALMKVFCRFCGCPASEPFFPGRILEEDEGDEDMEAQRLKALKHIAQTKEPSNANAIIHCVNLVQIGRGFDQVLPSISTAMEELHDHLAVMINERRLGDRMMKLTRR